MNSKRSRHLSVVEIKRILSKEEFADAKEKIEKTTQTLDKYPGIW